ncbi:MAG: NYN domain-containing protein [Planctomycetales bacterium]|nr:NYN domain-containing protein [Planctomycetales bacterium]
MTSATNSLMERCAALYIDWENSGLGKYQSLGWLIDHLAQRRRLAERRLAVRRVYGCREQLSPRHHHAFLTSDIEIVAAPTLTARGKNASDVQMAVDVLDAAFRLPHIDAFALLTGDSDFLPVVRKLRELGKYVFVGAQRNVSGSSLRHACDDFVWLDDLLAESDAAALQVSDAFLAACDLVATVVKTRPHAAWDASQLKNEMRRLDDQFDQRALGYRQFKDFLQAVAERGLVALQPAAGKKGNLGVRFVESTPQPPEAPHAPSPPYSGSGSLPSGQVVDDVARRRAAAYKRLVELLSQVDCSSLPGDVLQQKLAADDPAFDERKLGYHRFRDFLIAAAGSNFVEMRTRADGDVQITLVRGAIDGEPG